MSTDEEVSRRQVEKLTELSLPERRDRLSELGRLLSSESLYVQSRAMELVVELSEEYPDDVDEILDPVAEQLSRDTLGVDAARVFRNVAAEHPAAAVDRLPHMVAVIDSGGPVSEHLSDALVSIGETSPDALAQQGIINKLVALLDDDSAVTRTNATRALGDIAEIEPEPFAQGSDPFRERLDDSSPAVQQNAAYALGQVGETSPGVLFDAFEPLCRLLDSHHANVRAGAASALGAASTATHTVEEDGVASLLEILRSEHSSVRQHAAFVLAEVAADHPEAVRPHARQLTRALAESHPQVRQNVVRALRTLETAFPDAVDVARTQVSEALATVDPADASAEITVADLRGLANEETAPNELRLAAREAVVLAGREDAITRSATDDGPEATRSPTDQRQHADADQGGRTCSNCGEQYGSEATFCSVCGMSLE